MSRGAYKQYSDSLKLAIAESGNVNLFPELNIPKSTAYHWVKRGVRKAEAPLDTDKIVCGDVLLAVHRLLESVTSAIDTDMIAESQAEAIKLILSNKQLQLENWLPKNLQKKLSKRTHHCRKSGSGSCLRRYPWQLSPSEVSKMKRMVESSRYAHLPICSLALLAKRKGILSCSVHTWYKYVAKNQWRRPNLQKRKKPRRYCGLKAKHPHEYWHQDVTKIPMENGEFRSLQVILDNRSRAVLGWRLTKTVKAKDSAKLLAHVKSIVKGQCNRVSHVHLVTDGGSENTGEEAKSAHKQGEPRVLGRIARREIRHGNTMVEVFFKALKSNYLRHRNLKTEKEVRAAVNFYINQHNHAIPKVALNGLTPFEVLAGCDAGEVYMSSLQSARAERVSRLAINKAAACLGCPF